MLKKLIQWLLPATCVLCSENIQSEIDLCTACENDLPKIKQACYRCGFPLNTILSEQNLCGVCLQKPPPFDHTLALCRYEEPIITFINLLKFSGQLKYAKILNQLFINYLQSNNQYLMHLPECIIPVPLHAQRLKERGFNQALELCRNVATHFDIPILPNICQRSHATISQSLIAAKERRNNMKNAFVITQSFNAKHIAIIDDVVTTGSTVTELSHLFKNHGVEQIDIWCYAKTILHLPTHNF